MDKAKSITLVARVNITYKGESRSAAVYDDGTAVLDTGEVIELSEEQRKKIMAKYAAAKKKEEEAAAKAEAEARKAAKKAAREKARAAAELEPGDENEEDDYATPSRFYYQDSLTSAPKKPSVAKIAAATLIYAAVIGGTLFGSTYLLDNYMNKVSVAQLSMPMAKDSQFNPDNLTQLKMPESVYEELSKSAPGGLVLWEDAQGIVGKYIAMDAVKGQYISYDFVSDSRTMANPWIQNLDEDAQLYTIQFDPYTTYNQLLFAGSHVRMKAAMTILNEDGKSTGQTEVRSISAAAAIFQADDDDDAESEAAAPTATEADGEESGVETDETGGQDETGGNIPEPTAKSVKSQTEDRFGDVVVVDIINTSNESMFDVYLPLARMTRDERREFLTEKAKSAGAASYYARFTPMSLVFALDDVQVSELSKVEHMANASITYTLLPSSSSEGTEDENSMYLKFMEVQRDVNEIFGDAMASK